MSAMVRAPSLPNGLPSIVDAKLPASYEAAKTAIAECSRVDECKDWADRAAALASYAKQADDNELHKMAIRIQARAIRRCGELLREIKPAPGGRPSHFTCGYCGFKGRHDGPCPTLTGPMAKLGPAAAPVSSPTRKDAARDAGLSERQQKTALRVANVPSPDFEEAIAAEAPPTVTELAAAGTKPAPKPLIDLQGRDPREFSLSTDAQGDIRRLYEIAGRVSPAVVVRGAFPHERERLRSQAMDLLSWIQELVAQLEDCR